MAINNTPATILLCLAVCCFSFAESLNQRTCSYTVAIKTSCSSTKYTRDQISLSFGDAFGNQVYAPRLDDPASRTFERCSTDTFEVTGPCARKICHLYLYRSGYDGWKPETVKVYGRYTKAVTFNYNVFIPNSMWYGFDFCSSSVTAVNAVTSRREVM